jgi:hypothetical protein
MTPSEIRLDIPFIVVMACAIIQSIMAYYYCKKADKYKKQLKQLKNQSSLNSELANLKAPNISSPADNALSPSSKGDDNFSKAGNKKFSTK